MWNREATLSHAGHDDATEQLLDPPQGSIVRQAFIYGSKLRHAFRQLSDPELEVFTPAVHVRQAVPVIRQRRNAQRLSVHHAYTIPVVRNAFREATLRISEGQMQVTRFPELSFPCRHSADIGVDPVG